MQSQHVQGMSWQIGASQMGNEFICGGKNVGQAHETQTIWPLLKRASPIGGRLVGIESYNGVAGV